MLAEFLNQGSSIVSLFIALQQIALINEVLSLKHIKLVPRAVLRTILAKFKRVKLEMHLLAF